MIVRANDFSKKEFLGWVKVWMREKGLPVDQLVQAPIGFFRGRSGVADGFYAMQQMARMKKKQEDPTGENRKRGKKS